MADVAGIKAAAISMNAGDSYALFAGMLTNRPWEKVHTSVCLQRCGVLGAFYLSTMAGEANARDGVASADAIVSLSHYIHAHKGMGRYRVATKRHTC